MYCRYSVANSSSTIRLVLEIAATFTKFVESVVFSPAALAGAGFAFGTAGDAAAGLGAGFTCGTGAAPTTVLVPLLVPAVALISGNVVSNVGVLSTVSGMFCSRPTGASARPMME